MLWLFMEKHEPQVICVTEILENCRLRQNVQKGNVCVTDCFHGTPCRVLGAPCAPCRAAHIVVRCY